MAEKAEGIFEDLANLGKTIFNVESAKKIAAWYVDTGEKIANRALDFQATANEWVKETPLGPVFEAQNELGRKFVRSSAGVARKVWQLS
jgi:hypothetical protein